MSQGKVMRGQSGAAAVEFALVLPVLLLILFSILEYGWFMTHQLVLTHAVAAGARAGVQANEWDEEDPEDPVEEATRVVRASFWLFDISELDIAADDEFRLTSNGPRMLEVTVSDLEYGGLTGYLPAALLPKRLSARAVMVFP